MVRFLMAVDTHHTVPASELRAGMVVRRPALFKQPACEWATVEVARRYGPSVFVRYTDLRVDHPKVDTVYEVQT